MKHRGFVYYSAWFLALVVAAIALWYFWNPAVGLFSDLGVLRERIAALGLWGPVALIGFSVVQVLVAPLPGYPLVIVSGILYGTWWGALYANIGMLLSGTLAMGLSRRFGRPIAERFVERSHLERLEHLLSGNNLWLWFVIMLLPTGDYPYFVAGLSRVTFRNFFVAMFLGRVPFTFIVTHAAERSAELPSEAILGVSIAMIAVGIIAYWQQGRLSRLFSNLLERWAPHPTRHEN